MVYEFVLDKKNYDSCTQKQIRSAARAISFVDGKLIAIKSDKYGEVKFPGGGLENGETPKECMIRELKEETGLDVDINSIELFATTREIRKSTFDENELFDHTSYYYLVNVIDNGNAPEFTEDEKEYGYRYITISIADAIEINEKILKNNDTKMIPWIERELLVLRKLKEIKDGIHS